MTLRASAKYLVIVCIVAAACTSAPRKVDLGVFYDKPAQHHHETRNPAIVIPGILGTKLMDPATGQVVWGAFGRGAANPKTPEGARLTALPMAEGKALAELSDDVEPAGVLDSLKIRLAGLPFQLKAYFQILATLGAGGYKDETAHSDDIDYGADHFTCFQFDYDWRRDNVANARRLHEFILEKRAYVVEERRKRYGAADPDVKFDLIAHSMGGLITRYMLRYGTADLPADGSLPPLTWAGTELVDRAILVGTPNAGATEALVQLVEGRKFAPTTPRYEPGIVGTFQSLYQLLPRPRHGMLLDSKSRDKVDFMDPELWQEHGWGLASPEQDRVLQLLLPDIDSADERRRIAVDHLRKSLARAEQFHAALDVPAARPRETRLYLVAGDSEPTLQRVVVDRATGELSELDHAGGDGTVLRTSALMDERLGQPWTPSLKTPIDWTHVTFLFQDHLGLTKDPVFSDNVLYLLLEAPREPLPMPQAR